MIEDANHDDLTLLLQSAKEGGEGASNALFARVYDELHQRAVRMFANQRAGHTLQPTAIVHEAWLKLDNGAEIPTNKEHFFAVAVRAMRQIVIDHARARQSTKRGEGLRPVTLDSNEGLSLDQDVLALDDSLRKLASLNARHASVVEMRVFGGLSIKETAAMLGVSHGTVENDWTMARAWLRLQMAQE